MFNWSDYIRKLINEGKICKGMTYLELNEQLKATAHKLIPSRSKYIKYTLVYCSVHIVFDKQGKVSKITDVLL